MQSVSFPDLQKIAPSTLRKKLISEGVLVVTINNKPFAAMFDFSDENAQDTLLLVSRLRAQIAALSIRNQAHKDGLDKITLKEVNAVIKKTRIKQKNEASSYIGRQ
jgi:hypothetical protein